MEKKNLPVIIDIDDTTGRPWRDKDEVTPKKTLLDFVRKK